ncbi:Mov34/MPN/PAD-1 family protein [Acinetobacter sp. SK-43]|uniref:Mov34/MPN/PAD-1 family protein n=1 Tax=Acinetobacter sp. SK-43 TaxID=2785295 RepID=UPI00188D92E7|nr:Mov34/MPN/PAD-1 family protein [Acinetobacter sp. SK-43]MBF4455832.1 Mov34/MPN/PAD-1 family protein [Acinetobacter sp. SK-43]
MSVDPFFKIGKSYSSLDPNLLKYEQTRQLFQSCLSHPDFDIADIVELSWKSDQPAEAIIVHCGDGTVPTENQVGILVTEVLAIVYNPNKRFGSPYEVLALRKDFPKTPHLNGTSSGEPASLCLYAESWESVERTWTPKKFLQRVLWWLHETSNDTLHLNDIVPERLFYNNFYQVILPSDFFNSLNSENFKLRLNYIYNQDKLYKIFRASYIGVAEKIDEVSFESIVVKLPELGLNPIERVPDTLDGLVEYFRAKNIDLKNILIEEIKKNVDHNGIQFLSPNTNTFLLLLLIVPIVNQNNDESTNYDFYGFALSNATISDLGIRLGALNKGFDKKNENICFPDHHLFDLKVEQPNDNLTNIQLEHVQITFETTQKFARTASGIDPSNANFNGVLAGVGALGSTLAEIWSREVWGKWSYVDDDLLKPHNVIRHIGKDCHIGKSKVDVVKELVDLNYRSGEECIAIHAKINDLENPQVKEAIRNAELLVDVTTSIETARDLPTLANSTRIVSTFITPSGEDSVLLFEDKEQKIRIDALEAQYYRAILNNDWGVKHLKKHLGAFKTGGGCRDISMIISDELIKLHGAILARQIRLGSHCNEAQIKIWSLEDSTGQVNSHIIEVLPSKREILQNGWTIIYDDFIHHKLSEIRAKELPNETGGVILGYIDQKLKSIYIVDVCEAPHDSIATPTTFIRGSKGLSDYIDLCSKKTAYIVRYIGDWHSHPDHVSTRPSALDEVLLTDLQNKIDDPDDPVLMAIINSNKVSFYL